LKKFITVAAGAALLAIPATASAAANGYGNNGSAQAATVGAQCGSGAGSGAFGAFGNFSDVYHDFGINTDNNGNGAAPGTNGYQVGLNNSALCGNR
jgi:opacity protein-like surface antigen